MGSPKHQGLRNYVTFLKTVDIPTHKPYIILYLVLSGIILYIGVGLIGLVPSPLKQEVPKWVMSVHFVYNK